MSLVIGQTEHVTNRLAGTDTPSAVEQNCIVDDVSWAGEERGGTVGGLAKVAMLGVLNKRKRPDLAIDAVRATGHHKWQLVVIGDGPLRDELERENNDLVTAGALRFTGWLSQEDAFRELASCSGVIHPSIREGAPWAIAEALTMGKWVVTVEGNGADALVRSCDGGAIVPNERIGMGQTLGAAVVDRIDSGISPRVDNRWSGSRFDGLLRLWYFESLDGRHT
ncbi:glycosyltransferase [Sinomonas flava]|uniref:glycosyltransferase n=1 Tax=Sinomonas flava TaxID=496857 RepID=UPI0039A41032